MRIVFCGSGGFAVPSLQSINAGPYELAGIITQPACRAGRGRSLLPTPVAAAAEQVQLKAVELVDVNSEKSLELVAAMKADIIVVVDFGQFVKKPFRDLARLDAFNLHGSLLPVLRGAAPVNWAIIRGFDRTGVTTFSLVDKMDAGPMYLQTATEISPDETAEQLRGRLAKIGAEAVCRTLDLLAAGKAQLRLQDESAATFAPKLQKSDGVIDWTAEAETIRNLIHGCWPWPGGQAAFRRADGKEIPVTIAAAEVAQSAGGTPGLINENLNVVTGNGGLAIGQIKPAGKNIMQWRDFVNGYRVVPGDCFVAGKK